MLTPAEVRISELILIVTLLDFYIGIESGVNETMCSNDASYPAVKQHECVKANAGERSDGAASEKRRLCVRTLSSQE